MTLTEFLLARIAEDEAKAREAIEMRMGVMYVDPRNATDPDFELVAWPDIGVPTMLIGPERVLAECEAKRRIVAEHPDYGGYGESCATCAEDAETLAPWPCPTLRHLAAVYSDHPDYDEVWRT